MASFPLAGKEGSARKKDSQGSEREVWPEPGVRTQKTRELPSLRPHAFIFEAARVRANLVKKDDMPKPPTDMLAVSNTRWREQDAGDRWFSRT